MDEQTKDNNQDTVVETASTDGQEVTEQDKVDPTILSEIKECRKDTQAVLDACKELTKIVSELSTEVHKLRTAGRF